MELDIIATAGNYRARLELDDSPQRPEDDGQVCILQLSRGTAEEFNDQGAGFVDAFNRFGEIARSNSHQRDIFARYVRIFHGALSVQEYNVGIVGEYGYVAFDTAAWRDSMGVDPARLVTEDYVSEVRAWAEGDVYGVIVETGAGDDWDEESSVWGFYGREWAEEAAREELA